MSDRTVNQRCTLLSITGSRCVAEIGHTGACRPSMEEAVQEVARLRAEVERLTRELQQVRLDHLTAYGQVVEESSRLRSALAALGQSAEMFSAAVEAEEDVVGRGKVLDAALAAARAVLDAKEGT